MASLGAIHSDGGKANNEHAPLLAAPFARVAAGRWGGVGRHSPRPGQSGNARCLARLARPLGAGRLCGPLCTCRRGFRSRRGLCSGRWGLVRAILGQPLEPHGCHARCPTLAFLVARYVAGDWVARRAGGLLKRVIDGVDAEGWRFIAFVRLVPLFPFNLSNYVLGLTRIPLHHYVIATFVCMLPGAVAYTWLGHAGRGALTGEADTVRYGLLALGLLAAIALLPRLIARLRGSFAWIEANDLKRRLDSGATVTVIDVRGPDEFTGPLGHIAARAIFPLASSIADRPSLRGLNKPQSSSSAGPTSARPRPHGPCVQQALGRSVSCAEGWSNGIKPASRWKAAPKRQQHEGR
ncbi:MAG: TVP38/TMEM64 family protein [Rhodoplanes sp.]